MTTVHTVLSPAFSGNLISSKFMLSVQLLVKCHVVISTRDFHLIIINSYYLATLEVLLYSEMTQRSAMFTYYMSFTIVPRASPY